MLPSTDIDLDKINPNTEIQPSKTYKIDFEKNIINGYVDGIEAVKQAVFLILNTMRFEHIIYDNNYGSELINLIGQNTQDIDIHIQNAVNDALLQDERIISLTDFQFDKKGEQVTASFTVNTIFGNYNENITINALTIERR